MAPTGDRRWPMLVAACYGQILGGTIYLFGVYSETIKQELLAGDKSAQSKVQFLAMLSNLGTYLPVAGIIYDTPIGGARNLTGFGVGLMSVSYLLLWAAIDKRIDFSYPGLCVLFFFIGHSAQYFDSTITATVAKNFPDHRGQAIGQTKAFFGLSASIFTIVYLGFFEGEVATFMIFMSVCALAMGTFLVFPNMRLVDLDPTASITEASKRFRTGLSIVAAHAAFLMLCSILRATTGIPKMLAFAGDALFLVLLSAPAWPFLWPEKSAATALAEAEANGESEFHALATSVEPSDAEVGKKAASAAASKSLTLGQALKTVNFYLLWFTMLAGFGSGLTISNNSTQIFKALGQEANKDVAVSLVSVLNCFGRILSGMASDYLLNNYGVSRPLFLSAASAVNVVCFLLLATGTTLGLYVGCLTVGFTYGCFFALGPAVASEIFGLKHFASIYSSYIFAAAVASFVFSTKIASAVYEANIEGDSADCYGTACYRATFIVLGCCSLLTTFLSLTLSRATRSIYLAKAKVGRV